VVAALNALKADSLPLFDELDASLHPTLSMQLIQLFHDPATNPAGAQLVFTSHDTSLLRHARACAPKVVWTGSGEAWAARGS
jgi:AAA15 family ATPase/GTPase